MLQIAPHRYQSASGSLQQIGETLGSLGERALVIGNKTALDRFEDVIRKSLKDSMIGVSVDVCLGRCCLPEIERLVDEVEEESADIIIGVGAGNTLDVSKYVAQRSGTALVTVPTVASSCAAFTNIVYLSNEDGEFIKEERLEVCPDLVIVDYKIVGRAESPYLIAGMGTALASWYEVNLSRGELTENQPWQIAYQLADHMCEKLLDRGEQAIEDVRKGEITSSVEAVIEMNIMQTGLIRTLGGIAFQALLSHHLAHSLYVYTGEDVLFGDVVAYGVLVQEDLRGASANSYSELVEFFKSVDLPLTLDSLSLPENQREKILTDASESVLNRLKQYPVDLKATPEQLVESMWNIDEIGKSVIQSGVQKITDSE